MANLFKLFDGALGAGGSAAVPGQTGDSFSTVSPENDLAATLASGSDSIELLVDYSDFSNFVWFNSAESYVTLTADQILNEYPLGGTADDLQLFLDSLDGFQNYFLGRWPSRSGHLRLNPAISSSFVAFTDAGVQDGVSRTSFISPGTGSMSIQGWVDSPVMTGSSDALVVFQKLCGGTSDGLTVFLSASSVFFKVSSGSSSAIASGSLASPAFFAAVLDRGLDTGSLRLYVGSSGTYPVLTDTQSLVIGSRFDLASGSFYIGSGSVSGKTVRPFTGSLDEITVWSSARSLTDLSGTYNRKTFAQPALLAGWRFNDSTPNSSPVVGALTRDCAGHRLDGRIQSYFSGSRGSGSLMNDRPDPILTLDDRDVISYVLNAQVTGAAYDRSNQSLIFNLFPGAFTAGDPSSAEVFKNFALIMARNFDRIKLYVSQLVNLRRLSYGGFDQAPDGLLEDVGRYMGWDLQGSFASADALKYFIGRGIAAGSVGNADPSVGVEAIKSAFWRRTLLNLVYIYKTKGTRESVEALLRAYGADAGFVRLKEYARRSETRISTERVVSEKSVYALQFVSGASVSFSAR